MRLALFDLDGTLIPRDSDHLFGRFMVSLGWADSIQFALRNDEFYAQYQAGCLDIDAYVDFCTAPWRRRPVEQQRAAQQRFMAEIMADEIRPAARELLASHVRAGDLIAIVTATNEFVTRPIADAFGVADLIAVELERDGGGQVTGRICGTPSFREGKIVRVEQWLAAKAKRLADFETVFFYSDSANDLPLMEIVSDPVATNPSPSLEVVARERGWRISRLFE